MLDTANINDWDFPIQTQPIYDINGEPIDGHKAIMRTDTQQVLGVHGSRYTAVSHDNVVNSILDGVRQADLSSDYTVDVRVLEDGRKLRGQILFNDLVVEPAVGDYTKFKIDFFNSYDASWAFSQQASGLRLWCLNGCTTPDVAARSRYKHTASINVEGSANKMINGLQHFMSRKEVWQSWMQTRVTDNQVETFFKNTVAKAFTRQNQKSKYNERQLENLLGIWADERSNLGNNKWAVYNTLTYWATHTNDLRSPHTAQYNREASIASAMRSKEWEFA